MSAALDTDAVARHALAHDASHYLLIPEAVAVPRGEAQVLALLGEAAAARRPLTFRSAGTSLSGQAQSASVLADVRRHFRGIEVLGAGERVRVGPGATVREVNARLARHRRRLGPDPASEAACTIGGVIANNSSGMAAGTTQNSYRTLVSLRFLLASGTVVDTADADADTRLRHNEPALHAGLVGLRDQVRSDPAACAQIRERFSMKNTMGYGINALLDFDEPAQILAHLVIGSEGTLAFVSSAVFETVPIPAHTATGLLVLPSVQAATAALDPLIGSGIATAELLDARSLIVAQQLAAAPREIADLHVEGHAALLLEQRSDDSEHLAHLVAATEVAAPGRFEMTRDPARAAALWSARKGLYAAVAGARPQGSTALLEGVVVPVADLGSACAGLEKLFSRHGYEESVVFGHAKDGNIHFLLNEFLDAGAEDDSGEDADGEDAGGEPGRAVSAGGGAARLEAFTEDMVDLVLSHGGNLKAEHGTGRVMAPFVERQYGPALYGVMREIKQLLDPLDILNPGVVITDDPRGHLEHMKPVVPIEAEADRCVECGYCEPVCPSRDLTLTPRQRIVLRRDAAHAERRGDRATVDAIDAAYDYEGLQTCAVDGMCLTACPVGINTGDLVRRMRSEQTGRADAAAWRAAAEHWGAVTRGASAALTAAGAMPSALPRAAAGAGRLLLGADTVPSYRPELPRRGGAMRHGGGRGRTGAPTAAVLMPACVHTMFGPAEDRGGSGEGGCGGDCACESRSSAPAEAGASAALVSLIERAGLRVVIPDAIASLCCGTPFSSKGMSAAKESMRARLRDALIAAATQDRSPGQDPLPVVVDAASCTEGVVGALEGTGIEVLDATTWVRRAVLPRLEVRAPVASATVHPTCSTTHLAATEDLIALAEACADEVVVPVAWGCCAYAGDRGMLHPELTASATAREAAEVAERETQWYVSANSTCELGMQAATGRTYRHVLELVAAATAPLGR